MKKLANAPAFTFNGVTSTSMGVYLTDMPRRQTPVLSGSKAQNLGRDGFAFYSDGGYGAVTVRADVVVPDNTKLASALAWLSGAGKLTFSDAPTLYHDAQIITTYERSSPFSRLEGQTFSITWTCQPFRHLLNETPIHFGSSTQAASGTYTFQGQGHVPSRPLIEISGSSTASNPTVLSIMDGSGMTNVFELVIEQDHNIFLDCEAKAAYTMTGQTKVYAGERVAIASGSEWFTLRTNTNTLNIRNGHQITITPRWRFF